MSIETRLPINFCPECNKKLDAATGVDHDSRPEPNDVTVCLYCATVLQFNDDLTLRSTTDAERFQLLVDNPALFKAVDAIQKRIGQ